MSKGEITPTPWNYTWDDNGFHFIWAEADTPKPYICVTGCSDPDNLNEANVKAIITSVNSTYGAGINPEGVKDMYEALKMQGKLIECLLGSKPYKNADETIAFAKAAIDKAKL